MKTIKDIQPGQGEEVVENEGQVAPRTQSRRVALQALYQWQMTNEEIPQIIKQFNEDGLLEGLEFDFFKELISEVSQSSEALDALYADYLDRSVARIDPVERAIMRMGVYELQSKIEIPYKVVINESVELAKRFGAEESHKYVNGILDKAAKQLRAAEFA
ncbi:N utilization substance protein B [Thiomicrorhabdus immobilis]|uniref:Transcription antitermination protein NusB n=1 Tax=Thiomicrorhabdus immobilis TaxID=2791037 RepID=A0ABM7MDZ2_9GAMM|nr:transcription antitermination factor NusB [Thiomicrorhabdus immobilis]BCN93615.1 N utilization substance protein B [Thiomicrorhabdus immobilis]